MRNSSLFRRQMCAEVSKWDKQEVFGQVHIPHNDDMHLVILISISHRAYTYWGNFLIQIDLKK